MSDNNSKGTAGAKNNLELFFQALSEPDAAIRGSMLQVATIENVSYWSRTKITETRRDLSADIGIKLNSCDSIPIWQVGKTQIFKAVGRAAYTYRVPGEDNGYRPGEVYFEFDKDDRLRVIVDFCDPPHNIKFGGGPLTHMAAYKCDDENERLKLLAESWVNDGRWVEMNIDARGPSEITTAMGSPINAIPVGGVMDVIDFEDAGAQIRFQVEAKQRSGEAAGTYTSFAAIDVHGRIKHLAGFEGPLLLPMQNHKTVDPKWKHSYAAGYFDSAGQYAGGSEIMHLVPHKGKLYAANGYWEDSHWLVPEGKPKQSAQVLRLDTIDGKWEVDLDMGTESPPGLNFMKGNILKSVTFTKDGCGNLLTPPRNLLVMSAGTINTHVCAWVRDDSTGKWVSQIVQHGPYAKNIARKPGVKRWVPRAMELHTDMVSGQERIFLVLGNPGIISGVYNPATPSKISWDTEIEFPKSGYIDVRPLGMTEANGVLYFSGGGTIYKRIDGPITEYEEVLTLDEKVNVEMGGIRGLTAIDNPNGDGQSLLFMWVPNRQGFGQIKRLDPDGTGGFTVHDEAEGRKLINAVLGGEMVRRSVLGAYSEFYPLTNPDSGETIHLIGLQARVTADPSLLHRGYYAGGVYAIRTADQRYHAGEINGPFSPDKPVLKGPRSFAESPFGDGGIFAGGNDTNFAPAADMAWVFSAAAGVWLSPLKQDPAAAGKPVTL